MQATEYSKISIENLWSGISVKSVVISDIKKCLYGSGKGCYDIFVIDLETHNLNGNTQFVLLM